VFRSIFWKIVLPFTILVTLSMGVLGFYTINHYRITQIEQLREQMTKQARLIAGSDLPDFYDPDNREFIDIFSKKTGREIGARVTIIALDGTVLGDTLEDPAQMENHASRPEVCDALSTGFGTITRYSTTTGETMMYVAVPIKRQGTTIGVARVALPLTEVERSINRATAATVWATTITAAVSIIAAVLVTRVTTGPVKEMTLAAQKIASGDLNHRIAVRTRDELGEFGFAFNRMTANLSDMMATVSGQRNRLAAVLSNMADGVVMTDLEGQVILANPATGRLFAFDENEATGKPFIQLVREHGVDELLK